MAAPTNVVCFCLHFYANLKLEYLCKFIFAQENRFHFLPTVPRLSFAINKNVLSDKQVKKNLIKIMPETVELQQLVEQNAQEDVRPNFKNHSQNKLKWRCPYLGLLLAAISSLFFSLCSAIVKWMVDVDPMELATCRFVGVLLPTIPILIYCKEKPFPKGKRLMLLLRSFAGTTGLMLSFYAFRNMPLADANVVVFSVPVFVAIFARIFLKEPCGMFNVVVVILTLIGVILITRPPILFNEIVPALASSNEKVKSNLWGAIAAFAATLFGANVYILLRALKGLHFSVIMTNFGSFALIQTLLITYLLGTLCVPRCGIDRILIVLLAFFSFGGQILLTLALQLEQAGPVAIARSADIVFAFIWQIVFFKEVPNVYSVAGAILVTSSVILTGLRKWVLSLPDSSSWKLKLVLLTK